MNLTEAKKILKNAGYYLEEKVNRHPLKSEHFIKYLKSYLIIMVFTKEKRILILNP